MLTPRAAPNRVRLFFVACGGGKADNESSEKRGRARTRMCRETCGAGEAVECVECVECVEYVNHVQRDVVAYREREGNNAIGKCKKETSHAEVPHPRPLPTPNRLPLHVATSTTPLRHKPDTSHSLQNLAPSTINATDGVYPRPAPPPLSPDQLFLSHAAGRSALRFC